MDRQYNHPNIEGWGADLDHSNRPGYPMERIPPRDIGVHWDEPPQQRETVEILVSKERPRITRIFSSKLPPKGLSGRLREYAFTFTEADSRHWAILLFADRVDMVEGLIDDFRKGHVPNIFKEMGMGAELKYNRANFFKRVAASTLVVGAMGYLLLRRRNNH